MAYKNCSLSEQYLSRRGEFSTRPKRAGDSSDVAMPGAYDVAYVANEKVQEMVTLFETREKMNALLRRRVVLEKRLAEIKRELLNHLPQKQATALLSERAMLVPEFEGIGKALGQCRKILGAQLKANEEFSFESIFVGLAKDSLPKQVWEDLKAATIKVLDAIQPKIERLKP